MILNKKHISRVNLILTKGLFGISTITNFLKTGLIDLVAGIFTVNWERAWKGAEKIVDGFLGTIKSSVNTVNSLINGVINIMIGAINAAIRVLNRISFDLPDFLGGWHFGLNIPEIPKNGETFRDFQKEQFLRAEIHFWHGSTINREAKKTSKLLFEKNYQKFENFRLCLYQKLNFYKVLAMSSKEMTIRL